MQVTIEMVISVVVALSGAVGILFGSLMKQQKIYMQMTKETTKFVAQASEVLRNTNNLLVEVKDAMLICKAKTDSNEGV